MTMTGETYNLLDADYVQEVLDALEAAKAALLQKTGEASQRLTDVNAALALVEQTRNIGRVDTEAQLAGKAAGAYEIISTAERVNWSGAAVTARSPMLATAAVLTAVQESIYNALAGHESDTEAHGLAVALARLSAAEVTLAKVAGNSLLAPPVLFEDTFTGDKATVTPGRWFAALGGLPKQADGAAAAISTAGTIYGAVRFGPASFRHTLVADLRPGSGEASSIYRLEAAGNHYLVQHGSGGNIDVYAVTGNGANYALLKSAFVMATDPAADLSNVTITEELNGADLNISVNGKAALSVTLPAGPAGQNHGLRISGTCRVLNTKWEALAADPALDRLRFALQHRRGARTLWASFDGADAATIPAAEVGGAWTPLLNKLPEQKSNAAQMTDGSGDFAIAPNMTGTYNGITVTRWELAANSVAGLIVRSGLTGGSRILRIMRKYTGEVEAIYYNGAAYVTTRLGQKEPPAAGVAEVLTAVAFKSDIFIFIDGEYIANFPLDLDATAYNKSGFHIQGAGTRLLDIETVPLTPGVF